AGKNLDARREIRVPLQVLLQPVTIRGIWLERDNAPPGTDDRGEAGGGEPDVRAAVPYDPVARRQRLRDRVVDLRIEPAGEHVRPCAGTTAIDEDLSSCERSGRDALPHWRRGLGDSLRAKAEPMANPPSGGSW